MSSLVKSLTIFSFQGVPSENRKEVVWCFSHGSDTLILMMGLLIYMLSVNGIAFALMGSDKARARKGKWRIPERHLFLSGILGGGAGLWLGMRHFRHKTMHASFRFGAPLLILWNVAALVFILRFFG